MARYGTSDGQLRGVRHVQRRRLSGAAALLLLLGCTWEERERSEAAQSAAPAAASDALLDAKRAAADLAGEIEAALTADTLTVETIDRLRETIDAAAPALNRTPGTLARGDATTTYTAFLLDDRVVRLDLEVSLGDYGAYAARAYFAGAIPINYRDAGRRGDPAELNEVVTVIYWDLAGSVLDAERSTDGVTGELDATIVDGARAHVSDVAAEAVRQRAQETR